MTEFEEQIRRNLENDFGAAAPYSDFKPGESIKYRVPGGEVYTGTIVWVAAQSPSQVEGHADLKMRYIVERDGWKDSIPDVVYSGDILEAEPQEPSLERCRFCLGLHPLGTTLYCPLNPNRGSQKE
jgi:hypothetical protein